MRFTTNILPSRSGNLGILLLNNPKPQHALNLEMMHCMQDVLQQWYKDDTMAAILVKASTETKVPAFCAGGDVKQVYLSGLKTPEVRVDEESPSQSGNSSSSTPTTATTRPLLVEHGQGVPGLDTAEFFRQEYYVNHMLATASKPQISLWDGVVMGGGVGISTHGKYRVATERTVWAMPETAIGLFPDVGSLYWMPRLLTSAGMANYLALTGARLKAPDLIETGIATHYVPSHRLEELEDALENDASAKEAVCVFSSSRGVLICSTISIVVRLFTKLSPVPFAHATQIFPNFQTWTRRRSRAQSFTPQYISLDLYRR